MKHLNKVLFAVLLACVCVTVKAQDFSDPKFAPWGETVEQRQANILNSNFLKEAIDNRDYNAAGHYLQLLLQGAPAAASSTYVRGATVYKNKINRAKSLAEKDVYIDSLMLIYDLRAQHFGNHKTQGTAYIMDRKAREYATYKGTDRPGLRKVFQDAIAASGDQVKPDLVALYFSNLVDDFKSEDDVLADIVLDEYERLFALVGGNEEAKAQLDALLATSGAANCEALEEIYKPKIEAAPEDSELLAKAVSLMSRAECTSDFFFTIAEKYYELERLPETAVFLAAAFQNKQDFERAVKYLEESLEHTTDPVAKEEILVRLSLVQLADSKYSAAATAAREARTLNPDNSVPYFVLAQCYGSTTSGCEAFPAQAAFWAAYDTMAKAVSLMDDSSPYLSVAKSTMSNYRANFPDENTIFFNELSLGGAYTVKCGLGAGVSTTVRAR